MPTREKGEEDVDGEKGEEEGSLEDVEPPLKDIIRE